MERLKNLLMQVVAANLLQQEKFDALSIENAVSSREEKSFDDAWVIAFGRMKRDGVVLGDRVELDNLRELAFKSAFKVTRSSDIAGFVCDDFELIFRSLVAFQDKWVSMLLQVYIDGGFPCEIRGGYPSTRSPSGMR